MPMVIETIVAMLACCRIGAVHSVIFAGFSSESVRDRLLDSKARVLVTVNGTKRGHKVVDLKTTCDKACEMVKKDPTYDGVEHLIVFNRLPTNQLHVCLYRTIANNIDKMARRQRQIVDRFNETSRHQKR
jgi:acyl-coenzyme A synthetase/AMP-(fatty) acid ligase